MKSKCKHGFDVACLMCGFGEFEGKRVWFDWAWQEQQKELNQAYEDIETFATGMSRESEFKAQFANQVKEQQKRIEAALKIIQEMKEMRYAFPAYELEQALKGGDE